MSAREIRDYLNAIWRELDQVLWKESSAPLKNAKAFEGDGPTWKLLIIRSKDGSHLDGTATHKDRLTVVHLPTKMVADCEFLIRDKKLI